MTQESDNRPVIMTSELRFIRGDGTCYSSKSEQTEGEVKKFSTKPAVVKRVYGMTINMGNYESARVEVGVEIPCHIEDIDLADKWAADFCESRIVEEVTGLKDDKDEKKGSEEKSSSY